MNVKIALRLKILGLFFCPEGGVGLEKNEMRMKEALMLAEKGRGYVNPNPMVGAVIYKDSQKIGEGYHTAYGKPHAEREAIASALEQGWDLKGSTLYVTLEPCCHYGKTPPCTDAIIEAGITHVIVAQQDPNPLVSGKGVAKLLEAGIEVSVGVCEREALQLNRVFNHWIKTKRPYVILKTGMTLDGKITSAQGESKWITSTESRTHQQALRASVMAILVGSQTVRKDNPLLSCRSPIHENKVLWRVVVDRQLKLPLDLNLFKVTEKSPTLVVTESEDFKKIEALNTLGVAVERLQSPMSMTAMMSCLGNRGIDSLVLEGGSLLNALMLKEEMIEEIHFYMAPKLSGSGRSLGIFGETGGFAIEQFPKIEGMTVQSIGEDILMTGRLVYSK